MSVSYIKRDKLFDMDYCPFFADYDFVNFRPRGSSTLIDFFSMGGLASLVGNVSGSDMIAIKKAGLFPASGFFLVDFVQVNKNPEKFLKSLQGLKSDVFYVEDSHKHSILKVFEQLEDKKIIMVDFE